MWFTIYNSINEATEVHDVLNPQIWTEDGKLHFTPEYLEELRQINPKYFEELNLDDLDFELPEELQEGDIITTIIGKKLEKLEKLLCVLQLLPIKQLQLFLSLELQSVTLFSI